MDERSASPEIDVVGYSDRSGLFHSRSESFSTWTSGTNATALHAANQNGAKRLAANTNTKANKAETVNLRVRNMGNITVKKEPESDEDCEVSYSLSSLLQECDFEQAPRAKTRALKSPTSLAIAKSKSMEAARSVTGRSRQTLENVISSLKSARSTDTNQPKFAKKTSGFKNPVVPISMPSQIVSVAPTAQNTVSFPGSGVVSSGPQIVDVRSLATGAQTVLSGASVKSTRPTTSKPVPLRPLQLTAASNTRMTAPNTRMTAPNTGMTAPNTRMTAPNTCHTATAASNLPVTTAQATVSQVPASTIRISSASGPKPLNIRFVLPATEPFNTSEFQQVLQTALATVISQSKGVDASLLQQAIQAALTTLTKATGPVTANQLQQCIQSSLAALSGARPIPQVTPASLTQAPSVRVLQPVQKQPQAIAPAPPRLHVPLQSTSRTGDQISSATSLVSSVSIRPQIVTNASSLVVNGGNQLPSGLITSLATPLNLNQSPLNSARDALIKALQEKRVLNSPPSLSSSSLSSTSEASPSVAVPDSIDEPFTSSPPSSPALPTPDKPAEDSAVPDKSQAPTSAISDTTCIAKTMEQTTTTVTNTARTPLIVLRSGTYLKPNQSPVNSGTQTASIKMPVQVPASQGNSLPATTVMQTFTPQTTTVNLVSQTNSSVQSTAPTLPASKVPPVMVPTQLVQFSVAPAISSNTPVTKPESKPVASKTKSTQCTSGGFCAGGCCIYCRTCHENNNICGLPTCQKPFPNRAALRKHYYFNPTHKYVVPMEKSSIACDNFLPLEIGDSHRRARLRELFKRLPDDEFLDLVKPRVCKMISLFELLEQKSLRVQSGGISAFKMFTEFERFRRDVEAKLLELILLPQGKDQAKGSKRSRKDGSKPTDAKTSDTDNSSQGDQTTLGDDKQGNKDSPPSDTANTADQKLESSTAQPKTGTNSNAGSSETAEKTVDTICLDSDAERSTTRTSDTGAALADDDNPSIGAIKNDTTVEDKNASDSPLSEERSEESGKESGDVTSTAVASSKVSPVESFPSHDSVDKEGEKRDVEPPEQSSSLPQSVEANCESAKSFDGKSEADQPSEQTENVGHISDESTPKDTTSEMMEIDDSSKALQLQSSDVIMVDDQSETKSCSNDEEPKSRKEEQAGKGEKPIHVIDLVSKEDNAAVDANAEKNSEAAGRSVNQSADAKQEDKITEKPDGGNEIAAMDVEEEGNNFKTGTEKVQAKESAIEKRDEVGNEMDCAKLTSDEKGIVRDGDQTEKSKMDPENQVKESQQQETVKNKADGSCEGRKVETIDVDNGSDMTTASTSKKSLDVSMVTDKPDSDTSKDQGANKEKTSLKKDSDQVKEVPKSSNKGEETNPESTKEKITQECHTDTDSRVKESGKASSSEVASSSGNTLGSSDATSAGTSNSGAQTGSDAAKKKRKFITLEDLDLGDDDDDGEDGIDGTNMLDFSLPFAVKWGRIVQKVRSVEAKRIARKENYSEQDMKQFIYNKPKDAANAVIIADCHAHPSFFRAYVMPALLDKHIDDFGLFGKKLLSRLVLPRQKYVQILRNGIGPELAKILGINIFPTFKRIQDTWMSIRNPQGTTSRSSSKPVITIEAADDVDIPDDDNEVATAGKAVRPTNNSQNTADTAKDSLKRPGPADSMESDKNKRQRVDNTDSQKDASQAKECNKGQTESSVTVSQTDGSQPNEANKGTAAPGSAIKDAQDNKIQAEERNKTQTEKLNSAQTSGKTAVPVINLETEKEQSRATSSATVPEKETTPQPVVDDTDAPDTDSVVLMSVDDEQDPKSSDVTPKEGTTSSVAVEKPPCTTSAKTTPTSSCSTSKPSTSVEHTSAKTCASSIIPAKATIYTTGGGKKGASSVPLPTTKGSPLFLVPVERISPKLVEQYIQQGKGDGMKTRSSDKKKTKKPKQGSQVLVLIPSSNPNGSPTIQTLTSAEQLESTGDKKPLLLLPADKVPKSIASQSQTVRRKMVITMVAPSSGAATGTKPKPSSTQIVSATSTASGAAGQSGEPTSAVQSVKGPIMSTQEASIKGTSDRGKPATKSGSSASVDSSAKSLASVVNNTSALNVSAEDSSASSKQSGSGTGLTDGGDADSQGAAESKGSNSQSDEVPSSDTAGDSLKESSTDKESASNKETIEDGDSAPAASEASTSAAASGGDVDGKQSTSSNTELDLLGSSVLPSDFTLDSLLKDIEEDDLGGKADEMPPLDVSEIIRSFEDLPVESDSNTAGDSSLFDAGGDTSTVGGSSEGGSDIQMASSIQGRSSLQDEHSYAHSRRQSPRRTPASSKPASGRSTPDVSDTEYGLRKTSSPSGAKEDSDVDEGSPPRKRRKAPTRTSARSSPQVTFVPDKVAPGKSPQSSSAKAKGRKQ